MQMSRRIQISSWSPRVVPRPQCQGWTALGPKATTEGSDPARKRLLKSCWLYVFEFIDVATGEPQADGKRKYTPDDTPELIREYEVDAEGRYKLVRAPGAEKRSGGRVAVEIGEADSRGEPAKAGVPDFDLLVAMSSELDRLRRHAFVASDVRLSKAYLDDVIAGWGSWKTWIPTVSLLRVVGVHKPNSTRCLSSNIYEAFDPLGVAEALGSRLRTSLVRLIQHAGDLKDRAKEAGLPTPLELSVARAVYRTYRSDTANYSDCLRPEAIGELEELLDKSEGELARRKAAIDADATRLGEWLDSEPMAKSWHEHERSEEGVALFLARVGKALARFGDTQVGRDWIELRKEDPQHWVRQARKYFLPVAGEPLLSYSGQPLQEGDESGVDFQTTRKALTGVLALWEFVACHEALKGAERVSVGGPLTGGKWSHLIEPLNMRLQASGIGTVDLKLIGPPTEPLPGGRLPPRHEFLTLTLDGRPLSAAGEAKVEGTTRLQVHGLANHLFAALELFNLALAAKAYKEAFDKGEYFQPANLAGIMGSVLDGFVATAAAHPERYEFLVQRLFTQAGSKTAQKSLLLLGGVSALIDAGCALNDAAIAASASDGSVALGQGAVAVGSLMIFAGTVCSWSAAGAAATVVGLPVAAGLGVLGAGLVFGGVAVAALTKDTEMETLLTWTPWGAPSFYATGSGTRPWAGGTLASFQASHERQFKALTAFNCGFRISNPGEDRVRIFPGAVVESFRFEVTFRFQISRTPNQIFANNTQHEVTYWVRPTGEWLRFERGDAVFEVRAEAGEVEGRPFVDVSFQPGGHLYSSHVDVRLDMAGPTADEPSWLPYSGKPVTIELQQDLYTMSDAWEVWWGNSAWSGEVS